MTIRRGLTIAITVISAAVLAAAPAAAAPTAPDAQPPFASGRGSVGWASGFINGRSVDIPTLAECRVGQRRSAFTPGTRLGNLVEFGRGQTTCDSSFGRTSVQVNGWGFRLGALRQFGGWPLELSQFSISCESGPFGSRTNFRVSGLSGIRLPVRIPANYTVWIRGRGGLPVAKVVLNEVDRPWPPTGGVSVNLMHVWLLPNAPTINRGEFVIGSVSCSPRR